MKSPTSSVGTIELDGIYVINFSGGGPETDPVTDALIETVKNTAAAGVVPVIAAGNDRDDFGLGSVGSPGTAPAAVTVAAVTNSHIFAPVLSVTSPGAPATLQQIPIEKASTPGAWAVSDQTLVDVGTIVGANGRGDVMTSFSSAGPTDFRHLLKPDVSAPGGQILSSTLPEFAGSPFAVFDGTSMATPNYLAAPTESEDGAEQVYVMHLDRAATNLGVSVLQQSARSEIDPFLLGSLDENDVQGYAGTPVNANGLMFDYRFDVEAAGAQFPSAKDYYVAVDSARDLFTGERLPGQYQLRSWVNDVRPPTVKLLTTRVAPGRPTIAARIRDAGSGVDPFSLVIGYKQVLVGAAAYDPVSGIAVFPLPAAAPALPGRTAATIQASDYQETKNVNTSGSEIMPNTAFKAVRIAVAARPAVSWLLPDPATGCVKGTARLVVVASATPRIASVRLFHGQPPNPALPHRPP